MGPGTPDVLFLRVWREVSINNATIVLLSLLLQSAFCWSAEEKLTVYKLTICDVGPECCRADLQE